MKTFAILAAAALAIVPAAASATTVFDFEADNVGIGHDAYALPYTGYNAGTPAPANVAGVTFTGLSGVDFGAFGFHANGTQTAFLQTYPGLADGSFSLTGLTLVAGQAYSLTFSDVVRNIGFGFTVSQGLTPLGTFTADSTFTTKTFDFVATSGALTFTAINGGGVDASVAIDNIAIAAIPEPATWAMMLAGFGMIGFAARRAIKPSLRVARA